MMARKFKPSQRRILFKLFRLLALFLAAGSVVSRSEDSAGNGPPQTAALPAVGGERLPPPPHPLHAVQFINLEAESWEEVGAMLDELKAARVHAVIFRVFHNRGDRFYGFVRPAADSGVYFRTEESPVVADALEKFCELAHERSFRVFAWMTTRYADYGVSAPSLAPQAWDLETNRPVAGRGLSPLLPEVRERLARLFSDLAAYPVDGVLLQDDLIFKFNEDLSPRARELYQKATGRPADPSRFFLHRRKSADGKWIASEYSPEFWQWRRWENGELLKLAAHLRRTVHATRPSIPFGINLYYETITAPENALAWFAQDFHATLRFPLDFYSLMLYHRQMEKELNLSRPQVFALIEESLSPVIRIVDFPQRILVKFQSVEWETRDPLPRAELEELIRRVKSLGPVSLAAVMSGRKADLSVLK